MSGSDGRYMSIDSGPSAVSMAKSKVSPKVPGWSIGKFQLATFGRAPGGPEALFARPRRDSKEMCDPIKKPENSRVGSGRFRL